MVETWVELTIKCLANDDQAESLREMGIDTPDKTEWRPVMLNLDKVSGFYPDREGGCFVFVGDMELTVKETYEDIKHAFE